ncbi:methyl-accepting chemotaxis protein [Paenibacillus albiflavus]|uniref:Methyl-accepting chemotaxis protein n=1 Tax=Paenibacillus albiflavus TaxID=2545760 RepID=A0A4V6P6B1_9BACL|nr:HAMP domain-containing methyl-accepting chemotaxis protein [Paenibacillus albiflavus]TCZ76522.1 methyl-accepting chemotaxis protein [Paenibacillus albiflavus]
MIIIDFFRKSIVRKVVLMLSIAFIILTLILNTISYQREKTVYYDSVSSVTKTLYHQVLLENDAIEQLADISKKNGTPSEEIFVELEKHLTAATNDPYIINAFLFSIDPIRNGDKVSLKLLAVNDSLKKEGLDHFSTYELPDALKKGLEGLDKSDTAISDPYQGVLEMDISSFMRIKNEKGEPIAILGIDLDYDSVNKDLNHSLLMITLISFGISIMMLIVVAIFLHKQLSPLKKLTEKTQLVAQGDLTIQMEDARKDEFGVLKRNFNEMIIQIATLISGVKSTAVKVEEAANSLREGAEQTVLSAGDVTQSTQELASKAESQLQSIEETKRAIEEISLGVGRIAESSSDIADTVSTVSSQAAQGNGVMEQTANQMVTIKDRVHDSNDQLQKLLAQSIEIAQIVTAISEIANQTNLLSLNASIEAARAGEHGRGFNVVANEIRKLAERSSQSAENIANIIKSVQGDIEQMDDVITKSEMAVLEGSNLMLEVSSTFHAITSAMENINAQVQESSASTEQLSASIEEVNATIDELANMSEISSANAQNVAAATEEQLATMDEITIQSRVLNETSKEMNQEITKFKTK